MKWTSEPPTEPGWYWIKLGEKGLTYVVEVYRYQYCKDKKLVFNQTWAEGMTISVKNANRFITLFGLAPSKSRKNKFHPSALGGFGDCDGDSPPSA